MNDHMNKMWGQVDHFQQVEGSAWEVLRPLLDGSAFLSHINGSVYSPQVPEVVYKNHASTVNKVGLIYLFIPFSLEFIELISQLGHTLGGMLSHLLCVTISCAFRLN